MIGTQSIELRLVPASGRSQPQRVKRAGISGDSFVVGLPPHLKAALEREAHRTNRSAEGLLQEAMQRFLTSLPPALME
jgi:hypothetical protein